MSRADLSLMTGIPPDTLKDYEQGRRDNPRIDQVLLICGALGLRIGDVVSHPDREGQPWGGGAYLHP